MNEAGGMSSRHLIGGPKPPRMHPRNQKPQELEPKVPMRETDLLVIKRSSRQVFAVSNEHKGKVRVGMGNIHVTLQVTELRHATKEEKRARGLISD